MALPHQHANAQQLRPTNTTKYTAIETPVSPPDTGSGEGFSFERSADYEGVYEVTFEDGQRTHLSDTFMALVLGDSRLPPEQRERTLRSYEAMIESMYQMQLGNLYPDAQSESTAEPFAPVIWTSPEGTGIQIEQDPLASPYVRVTLHHADGTQEVYSMSRSQAQAIMAANENSPGNAYNVLANYGFRLPESARGNFDRLSREMLLQQVAQVPAVAQQEFVRMRVVHREVRQQQGKDPDIVPTPVGVAQRSPLPPAMPKAPPTPAAATALDDATATLPPSTNPEGQITDKPQGKGEPDASEPPWTWIILAGLIGAIGGGVVVFFLSRR